MACCRQTFYGERQDCSIYLELFCPLGKDVHEPQLACSKHVGVHIELTGKPHRDGAVCVTMDSVSVESVLEQASFVFCCCLTSSDTMFLNIHRDFQAISNTELNL